MNARKLNPRESQTTQRGGWLEDKPKSPLTLVKPLVDGWEARLQELFTRGQLDKARALLSEPPPSVEPAEIAKWREALAPAKILGTRPASGRTSVPLRWLRDKSTPYAGRWVFLDAAGEVVDDDEDLRALFARNPQEKRAQWTLIPVP